MQVSQRYGDKTTGAVEATGFVEVTRVRAQRVPSCPRSETGDQVSHAYSLQNGPFPCSQPNAS